MNFPQVSKKIKVDYKSDSYLNKQDFPKNLKNIEGGLIMRLPLIGIKDALNSMIDIKQMHSDEELVEYLESWLAMHRLTKSSNTKKPFEFE